jgi:hypothetical protein
MSFESPHHRRIGFGLLAALFISLLIIGLGSVDFGMHWDEPEIIVSVAASVETGLFLPRWYNYPSLPYDVSVISLSPTVVSSIFDDHSGPPSRRELIAEYARSLDYKIHLRRVFYILSIASVLTTFFVIYVWRRNPIEALLSAALLGTSWEFFYHSRWIAPDVLMAQFGVLSMLFIAHAFRFEDRSRFYLRCGATAAGLCAGTKYPGGIFLIPLLVSIYLIRSEKGKASIIKKPEYLAVLGLFGLTFLMTTPGALIEPFQFYHDLRYEILHYKLGHTDHNMTSPLRYASILLEYLAFAGFSKYWAISLIVFGFALLGAYQLLAEARGWAFWFLGLPTLYSVYFITQRVLFVRNFLIMLPFIAILAARGIFFVVEKVPREWIRILVLAGVFTGVALNLFWLGRTARLIQNRRTIDHGGNIMSFLEHHPDSTYFLSSDATSFLMETDGEGPQPGNVTETLQEADYIIFSSDEVRRHQDWVENQRGTYQVVSGIYEVNLDYYASWKGDLRVLAVRPEIAREIGIRSIE